MPTRYICPDCVYVSDSGSEEKCPTCDKKLKKVGLSWSLENLVPYFLAGIASAFLLIGFFFNMTMLIWFTFPLIGAGLLYDHLYQKQVDEALKKIILNKK